ncbi:hypothetical protein B4065_3043 [Caldibacillus thermoamylovorans]|uniref:metallophosphoesterase n=1 Tax=Bacillaceae TaxID=186817 RepID=UPI0005A43075|nr:MULTISPECIES: metallophosphoesterase [Bacillaceae]KIO63259.1 hypothetical protein B4065_3043 [Caldibacillus thermoamylovorans]PAC37346.1 metallophosphoesterase [Caldifermentibacillus hisashii]
MKTVIFIFCLIIFSILIRRAYQNTKKVNINRIQLKTNTNHDGKLTILHLTDMHLENISVSPEDLKQMVQNQKIDLIALTGDYLDRKRTIPKLIPYLQLFKEINPQYGIFAVFGNHDYVLKEKNFTKLKNLLENYGCKTLQNEHVTIETNGQFINIIGIDDYSTGRSNIEKAYNHAPAGFHLVLTHDPNVVLKMTDVPFDYLLSGHFHGGQIYWPKPYHLVKMGELARKKIIKGLHYYKGKPFYISEGLGQTGVNIRIGSRPEITFHNIHP